MSFKGFITAIDPESNKRLEALAKRSKRSESILAAEAIAAHSESEEWQLGELHARIANWKPGRASVMKKSRNG